MKHFSRGARRFQKMRASFFVFLLVLLALLGGRSANATTFTVTTPVDSNDGMEGCTNGGRCSLRDAILAANTAGSDGSVNTINFDTKVFVNRKIINVRSVPLPPIGGNLYLNGPTAPGTGVILVAQDENTDVGLVVVDGHVNISGLSFVGFGGGLVTPGGHTLVQNCTFAGNQFGIFIASKRPGTLTARNCTLFQNLAGVVSSNSPDDDEGLYTPGTLESCTIAGNLVGIGNTDTINLSNSIVAANGIFDLDGPINDGGHNIIEGDPEELGLDFFGLQDNGGPTPTLALLGYSPAINAGATSLPTDQRGFARDSRPDIGAFEFVNVAPKVVKVTPQGATDKVGDQRTFSLTVSDKNGATDIKEIALLINDSFQPASGASLVYDVQESSLSLLINGVRKTIPAGKGATTKDVLENGAIRIVGSDVELNEGPEFNSLTLNIPATIKDGLIGRNTLFTRVMDTADAVDPAALTSEFGYVRFGRYTVSTKLPNSAPTLSKLAPRVTVTYLPATGVADSAQTFGFFAQDADGMGDIREMWFMAGKTSDGKNSATVAFYPRTGLLALRADDGNSFAGSAFIGSSGILENSQVRVDLSKVRRLTYGDGKTLGLILPLQAKSGLLGHNIVWLRVQDSSGTTSPDGGAQGFVGKGNWDVIPLKGADTKPSNGNS